MVKRKRPHEVVASSPPEHLVTALVRNLAEALGGQVTYRAPNEAGELAVVAAWPDQAAGNDGLSASAAEVAREPVASGGVVLVTSPRRWGDAEHAMVRESVGWINLVAQMNQLRLDRNAADTRARALRAEVTAARDRFTEVREVERRRLGREITTTTAADMYEVRRQLRRLLSGRSASEKSADGNGSEPGLTEVRGGLDELIANFRSVVRGVFPAMLPDRGPQAALEELAATLRRPVRFRGDLGRRVEWHVEAGLYHAVAVVLNTLSGDARVTDDKDDKDDNDDAADVDVESAITVEFRRDDALRVQIGASAGGLSTRQLQAALGHDAARLAVLGGRMDCAVTGGMAVVVIRLPERLELTGADPAPARFEHSAVYRKVCELVRQGQQAAAGGPDGPRWDAVAERLALPTRLAVVHDDCSADLLTAADVAHASALNVTVIDLPGPADEALAREFLTDDSPKGSIDAVLCLVSPTAAFRAALRQAQNRRVVLSESASPVELVRTLASRGPVIAARRAIVAARELVSRLPAEHPLRWSFEQVSAQAHEIAELDLIDDLEHGDPRLLRSLGRDGVTDALQLLGARGADPRARLGLPEDADDEQVGNAASQAVRSWRARAEGPATGGRDRIACEVLVRTAEGLLSAARTP